MAVTITSVSPTFGHTGGRALVMIEGTGFRLPTQQAAVNGITPAPLQSVRVTFGSVVQTRVDVAASTLLYVQTAIGDPTPVPVDVLVENLDDSGVPIGGESATLAAAWRYVRPNVTDTRTDLVRVIDAFVAELERQIVPEVTWPANTDYDPDTSDTLSVIEPIQFPALVMASTQLVENKVYAELHGDVDVADPNDPDGFITVKEPDVVDIVFTIVGLSDNGKELLNLLATTRSFFKKNPYVTVARDPNDASKGTVDFELTVRDAPRVKINVEANTNNLKSFALTATIVGFAIESIPITDDAGNPPAVSDAVKEVGQVLDGDVTLTIEPSG